MACSLKTALHVCGLSESILHPRSKSASLTHEVAKWKDSFSIDFMPFYSTKWTVKEPRNLSVQAQGSLCVSRAMRWWEKSVKYNMTEIHSAQELVNSLLNAGDKLVIVDFYSPACGGCRVLHPKICQLAELQPDAIFLKVNYEELKNMSHILHIHVLPFFRFYRGSEGRVCSFSCTVSTIKKFKDALGKYGTSGCSHGPAKGLDETELIKLATSGELSMDLPLLSTNDGMLNDLFVNGMEVSNVLSRASNKMESKEQKLVF